MNDYKYYLDNGIFNIQNGKFKDGIENINKSIELKNNWEIPYFYRAVAYQALEEFDNAILDYTKALQLNAKMKLKWQMHIIIVQRFYYQEKISKTLI